VHARDRSRREHWMKTPLQTELPAHFHADGKSVTSTYQVLVIVSFEREREPAHKDLSVRWSFGILTFQNIFTRTPNGSKKHIFTHKSINMNSPSFSFRSAIITFLEGEQFEDEHSWIQLEKKLWCSSVIEICCKGEEAVRVKFLNLTGNKKIKKEAFNFDRNPHESFKNRDIPDRWKHRTPALSLVGWLSLCHSKPQRINMIAFIRWMGENIEHSLDAYRAVIIHIKMNALELFTRLAGEYKQGKKLYLLRFCEMWMREVVMKCGKAAKIRNVLNFSAIIDGNGQEALAKLSCGNIDMRFFREADDDKELRCVTDLFNDPNSQPVAAAEAGSEKGSPSSIKGDSDGSTQGQEAYHYHPPFPTNQAQQVTEDAIDTYESVEDTFLTMESFRKHMLPIGDSIDRSISKSNDDLRVEVEDFHEQCKATLKAYKARILEGEKMAVEMEQHLTCHDDQLSACRARTKQAEEALGEQATQITQLQRRIEGFEKSEKNSNPIPEAAQITQQLQRRIERPESGQMNSNPIPEQDRKMAAKESARDSISVVTPKHSTPTRLTPTTTSKTPTCRKNRFRKAPPSDNRPPLILSPKRAQSSENEHEMKRIQKKPKIAPASSENEHNKKSTLTTPKMSTTIRQTPTTPTQKISTPIRQTPTTQKGAPASSRGKNSAYDSSESDSSE
jgi:hypothetical protein